MINLFLQFICKNYGVVNEGQRKYRVVMVRFLMLWGEALYRFARETLAAVQSSGMWRGEDYVRLAGWLQQRSRHM